MTLTLTSWLEQRGSELSGKCKVCLPEYYRTALNHIIDDKRNRLPFPELLGWVYLTGPLSLGLTSVEFERLKRTPWDGLVVVDDC